jgi:hypothetical protein
MERADARRRVVVPFSWRHLTDGVHGVSKQKCVICGRDKRFEQTHSFPGRLLALGYKHEDRAHLSCLEDKEEELGKNEQEEG